MNGSKDPSCATKVAHIRSNVDMILAAVPSIVRFTPMTPGGTRFESDVIGDGFRTFNPQPDTRVKHCIVSLGDSRALTDHHINFSAREARVDEDPAYLI